MDVGALAQTLSIDATSVRAGESTVLVVKADGLSADVSALQFNLALPQGATIDEANIIKGEAASSHSLDVRPLANNNHLFVLYNLDMASIGNGDLLRLPITMYAAAGEYGGSLNTVRTATSHAEKSQTLANTDIVINTYLNEDEFTAKTKEGVTMIFKILDEDAKTCQVGNGEYSSVDVTTDGKVTIPEVANGYKVTAIGDKGFYNCSKLTHIYLHEGIESIGELAFYGCTSLRVLDIPQSTVRISSTAFEECSSGMRVNISSSSTYIPSAKTKVSVNIKPSSNPQKMERIYIPRSVTSIEEHAFSYCESVKKIEVDDENLVFDSREDCNAIIRTEDNTLLYGCMNTKIPETVTIVADYAFEGHSNLKTLYCFAVNVPAANTNVFNDVDISKSTLYVPRASIDAYKTTSPWSSFGTIKAIEDITGVKNISANGDGTADGKYLKDGKLVIVKGGKEYNAAGAVK